MDSDGRLPVSQPFPYRRHYYHPHILTSNAANCDRPDCEVASSRKAQPCRSLQTTVQINTEWTSLSLLHGGWVRVERLSAVAV